jgi:serine/threonine protein kinase
MKPERWQQIDRLIDLALEREEGERAEFLRQACANDEPLRIEVESLLAAHDQAKGFIETPAIEVAAQLLSQKTGRFKPGEAVGRYEIRALLGVGGMSEVYLAYDTMLHRLVALKLLPTELAAEQDRLLRFEQEARNVSALNHPNILTLYEVGHTESVHFIATEFVDGRTLRHLIADGGMKVPEILDVAIQVANALAVAHEAGIVHRDIKPENVMLRRDGYVKVLDFGIAKFNARQSVLNGDEAATRQLFKTATGMVIGTVNYMSPEQARGLEVDARTDIWSLGCLLYEMYTGRPPFDGATSGDVLVAILDKEPPTLSSETEHAPVELDRIVRMALVKERRERYQNVKEMAADLKSLKQRLEIEAKVTSSAMTQKFSVRNTAEPEEFETVTRVTPVSPDSAERSGTGVFSARKLALIFGPIALALVGIAVVAFSLWHSASNTVPPTATALPQRSLSYSLTVQKYREGKPYQQPFKLGSEINFEQDYRVRLNVRSPQEGYLYILNERPAANGATASFNMLFPSETANGGVARLTADQEIQIPSQSWFQFDAEEGTELIWLVWAKESQPELDALKRFVNEKDRGEISDPADTGALYEFLRAHSGPAPVVEKDDVQRVTSIKGRGDVLAYVIRLEHH